MTLSLVGLSHRVAPVELRERVTLTATLPRALARELGDAVCLSTCNRTELYLAGERDVQRARHAEELAGEPLDGGRLPAARRGRAAASLPRRGRARLARPGRGRDPRPGPGRLRGGGGRRRCSTGSSARRCGRQARPHRDRDRREPGLGPVRCGCARGRRSSATSRGGRCCCRRRPDRRARRRSLSSRGAEIAFVANRSAEPAQALATRFGGRAAGARSTLASLLGEVDVVVSSTSAPGLRPPAADVPAHAPPAAVLHRHRGPARRRPGGAPARRLLPLRHRRPRGGRRRDDRRPPRRGRAGGAARRRGG